MQHAPDEGHGHAREAFALGQADAVRAERLDDEPVFPVRDPAGADLPEPAQFAAGGASGALPVEGSEVGGAVGAEVRGMVSLSIAGSVRPTPRAGRQ